MVSMIRWHRRRRFSVSAGARNQCDVGVSSRVMERQVIDDVEVQRTVGWSRTCIKSDGLLRTRKPRKKNQQK
jgi:hypothetical protein